MRQWLKRTQSPQTSRGPRSPSHSHEFRQVISRLNKGFTGGHFLAYCLVSKESSYGIFLNERLLALDTQARELRYYSHIPQLPLSHPRDLPAPKEVVHIRPGVELQLEKVRMGHLTIRWEQHRQPRLWKLIMGSNQIAREFEQLFMQVLAIEEKEAKANETPLPKQYRASRVQSPLSPQKDPQTPHNEDKAYQSPSKDNALSKLYKIHQEQIESEPIGIMKEGSSSQRLNISLHDSRRMREEDAFLSSRYKPFEIQPFPQAYKQQNSLQKTGLMAEEWLQARNEAERAAVYSKFVRVCTRKVELMMENFMASHLMHEEYQGLHLIRDNDIELYYVPLIDSTDEQLSPALFRNVLQEEAMLEEWECLNFLSAFRYAKSVEVVVPMACLLAFKSLKFFCKNSLQMFPHKKRLSAGEFEEELAALEELTHLPIRNGKEEIYLIEQGRPILYFEHICCLPKITPSLPVSPAYIQLFITRGVISNHKDVEAISEHVNGKLIKKTWENMLQKHFSTSCQVMDFVCQSGLSQHFLALFLTNQQQYNYVERLVASEMVACAAEWQIRRRMQVQLFKKREFGFAVNQARAVVALLLQQDAYFATILNQILKRMFSFALPLPIKAFIQPQAMVISLFHRLGLDCRGAFLDSEQLEWTWSDNYINDYIQLTPFICSNLLRFDMFSKHLKILNSLIGEINYEINPAISLQQVLNLLQLHRNAHGIYAVSTLYGILPTCLRLKVNYYLSHFISPSFEPAPQQSLQTMLYGDSFTSSTAVHYYTHTLLHLTSLNKVRWLARMKYLPKVDELLEKEVEQATTWNQLHLLIQVYGFAAKLKLRQGHVSQGLECSLKALQYALKQYEKEPTVLMELVIAEQAFEAANFHFNVHNFTKALDLYSTVEDILAKISSYGEHITLNAEFLDLFVNKCSIHLLFGDYAKCFDECLSSLQSCASFHRQQSADTSHEFRIYEVLFRCYQIKNMRRQLVELTCICSQKYFEDAVFANKHPDLPILSALVKMLWISVIKQIESISALRSSDIPQSSKLKTVYLKKVRKELKQLRDALNEQHRYTKEEAATFLSRKILICEKPLDYCRLLIVVIDCLSQVTLNTRGLQSSRLYEKQSLQNQWLVLQMMGVLAGYDFLVGCIDDYLRIYDYQY